MTGRAWVLGLAAAVAAVVAAGSGGALLAAHGAAGDCCVGAVDVVKVFNEYQRQRDLTEEMKQHQDRLEKENQKRRDQIDALQATIDAMNPNDPTYSEKMRQLLQQQIDYKNWFDINQAAMQREIGIWTTRIYREITNTVSEVAQSQGAALVIFKDEFEPTGLDPEAVREQIRSRKVLYASASVDLTQTVLDRLNAAYRAKPQQPMLQVP